MREEGEWRLGQTPAAAFGAHVAALSPDAT